jgi:hypothetical protein
MIRRSTESSVKEEEEEEEDEDDETGLGRLSTISVRSEGQMVAKLSGKEKLTIVSPSALANSSLPMRHPPKMQRGATVSTEMGRSKEIRPTLKEMHSLGGGSSAPPVDPPPREEPKPLTRVLSRGSTEPLIKRVPTPAKLDELVSKMESQPSPQLSIPEDSSESSSDVSTPSPTKQSSRKHSDFKPSKLLHAPTEYDSHMERFGE